MKITDILTEAGDATLYHFAPVQDLISILESNKLGLKGEVSLTRDSNHYVLHLSRVNDQPKVVFLLDGKSLRQRFKLEPRFGDIRATRSFGIMAFDPEPEAIAHGRESEELLKGTIEPLSKYLKEIVISSEIENQKIGQK